MCVSDQVEGGTRSHVLYAQAALGGVPWGHVASAARIYFISSLPHICQVPPAMSTFSTFANYGICEEALEKLQELGLENPADLAFAFTGLEQASALGVGAAWMVVRRDAKAFAHTACAQWRGCKPSTGHGQSGKVTPASR